MHYQEELEEYRDHTCNTSNQRDACSSEVESILTKQEAADPKEQVTMGEKGPKDEMIKTLGGGVLLESNEKSNRPTLSYIQPYVLGSTDITSELDEISKTAK